MYSTHRIGILTGVLSLLLLSSSPAAAETTAGTTLTPAAAVVVTQGNVSDGSLEITFGGGYPFPDQCYDPDDNYVDYCLNNYPISFLGVTRVIFSSVLTAFGTSGTAVKGTTTIMVRLTDMLLMRMLLTHMVVMHMAVTHMLPMDMVDMVVSSTSKPKA